MTGEKEIVGTIVETREVRNLLAICCAKNGVCTIIGGNIDDKIISRKLMSGKKIIFMCSQATVAMSENGIESISHKGVKIRDVLFEKCIYDRVLSDF